MSSAAAPRLRRPIKVRGGNLGAFLCWAVIFADIGTSVYYVPGILYGPFGSRAALFVLMTLFVFVLLCVKYAEVTWRYPEGGGVVNVASQALPPFAGLLGGLFILVDYYLTAALSALSGALYLAAVMPALTKWALLPHPQPPLHLCPGQPAAGDGRRGLEERCAEGDRSDHRGPGHVAAHGRRPHPPAHDRWNDGAAYAHE
jgi:hypothetical protein